MIPQRFAYQQTYSLKVHRFPISFFHTTDDPDMPRRGGHSARPNLTVPFRSVIKCDHAPERALDVVPRCADPTRIAVPQCLRSTVPTSILLLLFTPPTNLAEQYTQYQSYTITLIKPIFKHRLFYSVLHFLEAGSQRTGPGTHQRGAEYTQAGTRGEIRGFYDQSLRLAATRRRSPGEATF